MLDDGSVASEARLAEMHAEDKSTIDCGLALQKVPAELLDCVADRRTITQSQWFRLAPLLEREATRGRGLERLGLLAGQHLSVPALTRQLTAAAAEKHEIATVEEKNRHGKVIAAICPDHRCSFTVRIKSMAEAHPSYRLEWLKLIDKALFEVFNAWFLKED